jgi:hypothetical protein
LRSKAQQVDIGLGGKDLDIKGKRLNYVRVVKKLFAL